MLTSRWIAVAAGIVVLSAAVWGEEPKPTACGEPSYDGKGLGHWLAELRDANPAARRAAVHALGCLHPPTKAVIPALIAALKDPDLPVRSNAAASVVRVDRGRIKEALPALIAGLKSQETDVRRDVAEALGEAGPAAGQASPDLIGALHDPDRSVRKEAAIALAAVDPERAGVAVPHLMEALKEGALCIGPPPAFWALRKIGISAKETIPALVAGLKDSSVRLYCAYTLGLIGPDAQAAIPALVEARAHADAEFRCCAAMALVDIDPAQAKQAVIVLAKATRDPSDKVRDYVIHAVGEIGPQAKEAVPELLAALTADQKKRQSDAGLAIAQALGEIGLGAKEAVPALVAMMKADDPVNRFAPTMALGWMGSAARPAVPALKAAVEKGDPEERWFAARALVRVDRSNADAVIPLLIAGLTEVLRGHDDWLAPESLELCEALGPSAKAAAPVLLAAHKECRPAARPLLTRTLSRIDPDSAATLIPALIRNLKNADPEVRRVAIEELGIIGPPAREAVPALRALLKDPDYSLDAATALGPISGAEEETMAALMGELTRPETAQRRGTSRLNQQKTDLLSSLKDPSQSERLTMIRLLSQVFDPMPFSEGLVEIRSDSNVLLCRQVAKTLGDMGPSAKAAIPALLESRKDPDAGVRLAAACALPRVDPDQAKDVIPDLTTGLKAQEWWVRAGAARALGTIGSNAKTAAPALIECLNDPVKPVRKESANALKKIDPQRLASR